MKALQIISIILISTLSINAQDKSNLKDASELLATSDFSRIFDCDKFKIDDRSQVINRMEPLGFFGDNYQRIFIHFISVIKNNDQPNQYFVHGKSKLKKNICDFQGTITIEKVLEYKQHEISKYRRGEITGTYTFHEDQKQKGTGKFVGAFRSFWLLNKENEMEYDAAMFIADGFSNNEFEGKWISHSSGITKKCNWGDYRIPDSKELDGGAGEFFPEKEYWDFGWQTYVDQWNQNNDATAANAKKIEHSKWWQ